MTDQITLYTNPMSRGRIARWMLEEVGVPYEAKILTYGEHKTPEFLAINPMGKFPTLVHGETVITECAAICAYLADAFPNAGLAPPHGSKERGTYYRWLFYAAGPVEAAVVDKSLGVVIPDEKKGMVGYGCFDDVISTMERALEGKKYLLGDNFSAADVYFGAQILWGLQFGSIPARPLFEKYAQSLKERPAAIRAAKIDDDLIAASNKS